MPRNKVRRPWLDYLVYLAVRLVVAFAQMLTIEQSYALARFLAWCLYQVDARHRKVGLDNLASAFGDRYTDAERDRIIRGVYLHFCSMLMEILHTPRKLHLTNWRERVAVVGHEPMMDQRITGGRPMILLTGHYGNWELAGYLFGLFGFPTVSVARTLDNPYLDRYLRSFRERTGQSLIPKTGGFDQMVEVCRTTGFSRSWPTRMPASAGSTSTSSASPPRPTRRSRCWPSSTARRWWSASRGGSGPGFRYEIRCEDVIDPADLTGTAEDVRHPHPALHLGPRAPHPPGPDPVPLAPSSLEASAQREVASWGSGCGGRIAKVYLDRG